MLSIRRSTPSASVGSGGWAELLDVEERHVSRQGFGAGVLAIHYGGELLRYVDEDTRALTEAALVTIIDRHLGWTDRSEMIAPGRLGVVVVPIEGPLPLGRRARELYQDLRGCGVDVDIAYSVRRNTGGLVAAAARADAALDTVIGRRAGTAR